MFTQCGALISAGSTTPLQSTSGFNPNGKYGVFLVMINSFCFLFASKAHILCFMLNVTVFLSAQWMDHNKSSVNFYSQQMQVAFSPIEPYLHAMKVQPVLLPSLTNLENKVVSAALEQITTASILPQTSITCTPLIMFSHFFYYQW